MVTPAIGDTSGDAPGQAEDRVCVGVVVGPHGIRGLVRVKSFTAEPEDVAAYGPLSDEAGRAYSLTVVGRSKGVVLCAIDGVDDRTAAEAIKGVRLYVDRAVLPPVDDEDEFYHADLIGLRVGFADGTVLGTIAAVFDFGAGDVLEVRAEGGGVTLLPFTRQAVPVIDLAGGKVVAERLAGLAEDPPKPPKARTSAKDRARDHAARRVTDAAAAKGEKGQDRAAPGSAAPGPDEWPDEDWH